MAGGFGGGLLDGPVLGIALAVAGLFVSEATLAQECPLATPLILEETQDGVVGRTGTVWTIAPDCSFTAARRFGPNIAAPDRRGRLTAAQQAELGTLLRRARIAELPEQFGAGPQVNMRQITLSYNGRVSVLSLPPGGNEPGVPQAGRDEGPAARLLGLAGALKNMIGG